MCALRKFHNVSLSFLGRKIGDVVIILLVVLIFVSANFELIRNFQLSPASTRYMGAGGFFFDYYQFLSWMRDGQQGRFLISSRYIPTPDPGVLLHPFFPLIGFIGQKMHLRVDITYHIFRNLALAGWLAGIYFLVRIMFSHQIVRKIAYMAILLSGGFPMIIKTASSFALLPFIDFWKTFYPLEKFIIPPHHLLANTVFICLILCIIKWVEKKKETYSIYPLLIVLSNILMLVNPASMTFLIFILSVIFVFPLISLLFNIGKRNEYVRFIRYYFVIILSVLPLYLYNYHIFSNGNPWKYFYLGEKTGRYLVSFFQYIASLGPFLPASLLSVFYFRKFGLKEKILFVWLALGVLIFPFAGRQIPFSMSRLFAQNLFIPGVLLTVFFLVNFRLKNTLSCFIRSIIILILFISTTAGVMYSFSDVFMANKFHNYYNVSIPDNLMNTLGYINKNSRNNSTVIAGENISSLIPSFADNRVVLGRLDAYPDYGSIKRQVDEVYGRLIADKDIIRRLKNWNVQYMIFGLDQINFREFIGKGRIDSIKKVFESGEITVAEVI